MGNSHSHPAPTPAHTSTSTSPLGPPSALRPRSLKHHKSTPHSLRPLRARDSPAVSRSPSPSFNSFSEKDNEREKENQRPTRTTGSLVRLSPPLRAASVKPPSVPVYTHIHLPSPAAGLLSASQSKGFISEHDSTYVRFLHDYPQYASSWHVDALRRSEYSRLAPDDTYVDYMGGALYPASLISVHAEFLQTAVLGNTHSESASSKLSAELTSTARAAVLSFFNAPPGSTVIFTANASAALKLVGESFPFTQDAAFVLPEDAHNSVHGIREFARTKGAPVVYLPSPPRGGVRVREALALIDKHHPPTGTPALFAYTGQSNITNSKPPLAVLAYAAARGFTTLLDAAALAPTTPIDLTETPVDAVAVSFYKMFGFPTGIGALVLAPGIGVWLREKRPWFSGGTVSVVQVPGTVVGRTAAIDEAFEDGTLNYTLLPAVTTGLRLLSAYLPALPKRMAALSASCARLLEDIRWPRSNASAVRILSRIPGAPPEPDEATQGAGGVVSCLMLDVNGDPIPLSRVAAHAAANGIALRTGCMCNPGGAAALLSFGNLMAVLGNHDASHPPTLRALEEAAGRELGVVRISFGLASCWSDVWRVRCWVIQALDEGWLTRGTTSDEAGLDGLVGRAI
ncbi:pyridoxal phosphate-dependent transferase [Multifurca ochricompacta]|uniref:Pyridoxal phosphate-dependent transferase n=1 Tax=Multifurca ochricompacta TaxID=376703 RepID=A0AAD4M664_9AGAM|nr:pyridoxal phosphate-dependent transferase [Multifurca ochricompacta]